MGNRNNVMIRCVALKEVKIGSKTMMPPDGGPTDARIKNYVFQYPAFPAAALAKKKILLPFRPSDADTLQRATGYTIGSYLKQNEFEEKAEKAAARAEAKAVAEKPAEAPKTVADEAEESLVEKALRTGKKADLVAALEAEGLDPADYSNNNQRTEALEQLEQGKDED